MSDGISYLLTILGVIIALYLYLKARPVKNIAIVYKNTLLQARNHPLIKLYYADKEVINVNRLTISFYNYGNSEVKKEDTSQYKCAVLRFKSGRKILSSKVNVSTETANNISLEIAGENELHIMFDYLNPSDGCQIEMMYEGEEIKKEDIEVELKIIGNYRKNVCEYKRRLYPREIFDFALVAVLGAITLSALTYGAIYDNQYYNYAIIVLLLLTAYVFFRNNLYDRVFIITKMPALLRKYKY